ncbi:MAG: DUF374 domain-containing protein [Labilithrix sp.]|nr:DUF374 domain-containing protein [Labilithrix sp.]
MFARALAGWLLGLVARAWLATLRIELEIDPELRARHDLPWVFAFFHGTQWPLLAWRRRRPTVVMVSHSADGAMQSRALTLLGLRIVRGSSSRGGARGLAALVRRMKREALDAAFAVDGPRGPYGDAKPGVVLAARAASGIIVPMGSATERGKVFARAWDRFALAWPWSRVSVVLGAPLAPSDDLDADLRAVGEAIRAANARAAAILTPARPKMLASLGFSERSVGGGTTDSSPSPFGIE